MLLAASSLASIPIRAFVDSDPGYHGGTLDGHPIIAQATLKTLPPLPMIISSHEYQHEIAQQIAFMGLANPVHLFYATAHQAQ